MPKGPDPRPDWLKPENKSVFDSPIKKALRTALHWTGMDDPTNQVLGLMAPLAGPGEEMLSPVAKKVGQGMGAVREALTKRIRAFHGSPHDFEKFSTAKIGTGEGAQAYGHGLYFAENEGTARTYRDALGGDAVHFPGGRQQSFEHGTPEWVAQNNLNTFSASPDVDPYQAARRWIRQEIDRGVGRNTGRYDQNVRALEILNEWETAGAKPGPKGRMYEVSINADPETFLDWDKPLSQQSQHVQRAVTAAREKSMGNVKPLRLRDGSYGLTRVGPDGSGTVIPGISEATPEAAVAALEKEAGYGSGQWVYDNLARTNRKPGAFPEITIPSKSAATDALREQGIPGIKYLDQGSRSAGQGTYNYVVFDDSLVSILKKYGVALPMIEALRQKAAHNNGRVDRRDVTAAASGGF